MEGTLSRRTTGGVAHLLPTSCRANGHTATRPATWGRSCEAPCQSIWLRRWVYHPRNNDVITAKRKKKTQYRDRLHFPAQWKAKTFGSTAATMSASSSPLEACRLALRATALEFARLSMIWHSIEAISLSFVTLWKGNWRQDTCYEACEASRLA